MSRPPHQKQRSSLVPNVSGIGEGLRQETSVCFVVGGRVILRHQNLAILTGPTTTPRLIRPAQAERKIRRARAQHFVERTMQQSSSAKPVVVVTESVNAVSPREIDLRRANLRDAQIVESKVCRKVRLIVPRKKRACLCDVRPFGESAAPPLVVLWDGMELRKVECDRANLRHQDLVEPIGAE